ncbi:5'-nucleotidase [Salegentibacter sp. F188]|uniref:5'-nucleotidase n=1 Tax=Autumnicola patrickiae TaxID=3075591 RepID=A0ABU3DX41_9FLAO|nr:5'-nucleotidase [Salegentibacter sp. F188]MDT0688286.1 5'-nucleotidase [Salegentibacter sp. F188]
MKITQKAAYILGLVTLVSCNDSLYQNTEISGERIPVDQQIKEDTAITNFIQPYKEHLNVTLDSTLAFNPTSLSKTDGTLNTAIGNLMADIVMEQANPVFKKRTGKNIDVVLLNHGGIRSTLNQGNISARSAYALMPFENEIVVAELNGLKIMEMLRYLEDAGTAHPVSGIKIQVNSDYKVTGAQIDGREIDSTSNYFVATSDYLQQGGDNMNFFKNPVALYNVDYKLRNAIIDYFSKVDTLDAKIDDRYIVVK